MIERRHILPNKPIKLYFALLNHGWLRREFASTQLPQMIRTPGVELVWEEPSQTWGHPIYSNRNRIVKRFLATDCDFLMMQDDDIVPHHNPAELVFADKDVIGCPAKVRTDGGTLDWVAYVKHAELGGFVAVDMGAAPTDADIVAVDIVGTGLICIKRKVLESIKAPFLVENDEDGCLEWGTDFAFCKRARAAGFEIYTTPYRVCEHYKELGMLQMDAYDDSDFRDNSNAKYGMTWGGWAISQKDWAFIKRAMDTFGVKRVVEFGAGLSSLLMSEVAEVVTYETNHAWAESIKAKAGDNRLEFREWDGVVPPDVSGFDMVFIDGPPGRGSGGIGREKSYEAASKSGVKVIITHDSGRQDEMAYANRFLRGKYDIKAKSGNHEQRSQLWLKLEV